MVEGEGFRFQRDEKRPLAADAVVVDEASMMDVPLAYHLVRAIVPGTRLIFVGDVQQLPPVGPGYPLRDIIDAGRRAGGEAHAHFPPRTAKPHRSQRPPHFAGGRTHRQSSGR